MLLTWGIANVSVLAKDKGIIKALRRGEKMDVWELSVLSKSGLWKKEVAMSPPELGGSVDMMYLMKPVILLCKRYSISLPGGLAWVQGT